MLRICGKIRRDVLQWINDNFKAHTMLVQCVIIVALLALQKVSYWHILKSILQYKKGRTFQ